MALGFILRSIGLAWNVIGFILLAHSAYKLVQAHKELDAANKQQAPVAEPNLQDSVAYLNEFKKAYASKFKKEAMSDEMVQKLSRLFGQNFLKELTKRMNKEGK